jgi:hypothetical protein
LLVGHRPDQRLVGRNLARRYGAGAYLADEPAKDGIDLGEMGVGGGRHGENVGRRRKSSHPGRDGKSETPSSVETVPG